MALILLVEDDALISRMLALRLKSHGHQVELASDGQEGIERTLDGAFDLVLMDMHMPVIDGHEAVRRLREEGYTGTVVAVTASAMSQDSQAAIAAGCDHFISKPIGEDFEELIDAILAG